MGVRGPGWSPAALMYGAYGQIATRADGKIQCHECGRWWVNLGGHITRSHEMTVREYKLAYGLPLDRGLSSEHLREQRADQMRHVMAGPDGERRRQLGREHAGEGAGAREPGMVSRGTGFRPEGHAERVAASLAGRVPPVVCAVCGSEFRPANRETRTCSGRCWSALVSRQMRRRRRDPVRDAEIRELRARGLTMREIGQQVGLSVRGVAYI